MFNTPSKKNATSWMSTPGSERRQPGKQACNLTEDDAIKVVEYLKDKDPASITKEHRVRVLKDGKPTSVRVWRYIYEADKKKAEYSLIFYDDGLPLIPAGSNADIYVFQQLVLIIHVNQYDVGRSDIVECLCKDLESKFHVVEAKERVTHIMANAALFTAKATGKLQEQFSSLENGQAALESILEDVVKKYGTLRTEVAQNTAAIGQNTAAIGQNTAAIRRLEDKFNQQQQVQQQLQQGMGQLFNQIQVINVRYNQLIHSPHADPQLINTLSQHYAKLQELMADLQNHVAVHSKMPNPIYYYSKCCTINSILRALAPNDPMSIKEKEAIEGFLQLQTPLSSHLVYRGVNLAESPQWARNMFQVGGFYTDNPFGELPRGFTSTSLNHTKAMEFAMTAETHRAPQPCVMCIQHQSGVYVEEWVAEEYKDEEEVLFSTGVCFRIESMGQQHVPLGDGVNGWCLIVNMKEMS